MDGKFSGLSYESRPYPTASNIARRISSPPLPSSALLHPLLLRPFPRPIYRVQRSAQYPAGNRKIRIGISHLGLFLPSPCRAFVRNSLIKRCQPLFPRQPYTVPLPLAVVGCDPSNLPISFFRQGAPISIVRATVAAVRPVNKTVRQSCTSHTARPKLSLDIVGRWFAESLNGMNRISNSF